MSIHQSPKERPILVILHQEHSTPGRVGLKLKQMGYSLDIRKPRFGDEMPTTMDDHEGAIIFGGPMSVNDDEEWIKQEINWIDIPLKENRPFFGICLGGQMLTKLIGGEVYTRPDHSIEVGYYPLYPNSNAHDFMPDWPDHVYQWHTEWMRIPDSGVKLLAKGEGGSQQAIRVGESCFGIQFHPEVTRHMIHRWTTRAHYRLVQNGAKTRREHIHDRYRFDPQVDRWLEHFLERWLSS